MRAGNGSPAPPRKAAHLLCPIPDKHRPLHKQSLGRPEPDGGLEWIIVQSENAPKPSLRLITLVDSCREIHRQIRVAPSSGVRQLRPCHATRTEQIVEPRGLYRSRGVIPLPGHNPRE